MVKFIEALSSILIVFFLLLGHVKCLKYALSRPNKLLLRTAGILGYCDK